MDVSAPICDLRIIQTERNRVVLMTNTTITVSTKEEVRSDRMPNVKDQSMQVDPTDLAVILAEPGVQTLQQPGENPVVSTDQEVEDRMSNPEDQSMQVDPTDLAVISAEPGVQNLQQPGENPVVSTDQEVEDRLSNPEDHLMQVDPTNLAVISAEPGVQNLQQPGENPVVILTNQSEAQLDMPSFFDVFQEQPVHQLGHQDLTQIDLFQIEKELSRTSTITTNIDNINATTAPIINDEDSTNIEQVPFIHNKKILGRIMHYESTLKRMIQKQNKNVDMKTDSLIRFFVRTAFDKNFCGLKRAVLNKKQKSTHVLHNIMKDENKIKCNDKKLLQVFEFLNITLSSGSAHMIPREDYDDDETTLSGSDGRVSPLSSPSRSRSPYRLQADDLGRRSRSRSPYRLQADDLGRPSSPMRSNHIYQISDPLTDLDYSCPASEVRVPMKLWRGILSSQQQNLNMMKTLQIQHNPDTSRIVHLPEFDPEKRDSDAKAWSSTVGLILGDQPLVGGALVVALSRSLKGSASRWLAQVSFEGMQWEQFKDIFLSKYVESETPASTLLGVLDGKPNEGENYSAYAERILSSLSAGWQGVNVEEAAVATVLVHLFHLSQFDCRIRRLIFASDVNNKDALLREMEKLERGAIGYTV